MLTTDFAPVAVIGYGCLFPPDSYNVEAYWRNLLSGRSGITTPPPQRYDWRAYYSEDHGEDEKTYCKFGGFIADYRFPAETLGVDSRAVRDLNRTQLMVLDTTMQAIASGGYTARKLRETSTALFVANMLGDELMVNTALAAKAPEVYHFIGRDETFRSLSPEQRTAIEKGFFEKVHAGLPDPARVTAANIFQAELAKSVSRILELPGPAVIIDAACAAGLAVIDVAVRYLQDHTYTTVLACGALGNMSVTGNVSFAKIGGLSATHSAPLDASANGLIPGEGAGTLLLKRLDEAVRDGDPIRGVISGIATRSDGKGKAVYAPSSQGQVSAMRRALQLAHVRPEELDHIETHATSTPVGDATEVISLKQLFDGLPSPAQEITLGSVKAQTGHTFSAAGMANVIKILLAFEHETLPPTHNFTAPQPQMQLGESPFRVPTSAEPWPRSAGFPRRVLSNAFGFGGVNTSICLEQYDPTQHRPATVQPRVRRMTPLAVVGIGCITPFAASFPEFDPDRAVDAGVTGFPSGRWLPSTEAVWDADQRWRGGVIQNLAFPWKKYRLPPSVVAELDRAQLLAVMAAGQALEHSGPTLERWRDAGVFIGATCGMENALVRNLRIRLREFAAALAQVPEFAALDESTRERVIAAYTIPMLEAIPATRENALPGYMDNIIAGRICNLFNLRGPGLVVDDDASSFGAALDIAVRYLEQGECSAALVGSVHANLAPEFTSLFARRIAETGQPIGTFIPAEAAVFFMLEPLDKVDDPKRVHAVITAAGRVTVDPAELHGDRPFYFGAQGALRMLDLVADLKKSGQPEGWTRTPQLTGGPQGYHVHLAAQGSPPSVVTEEQADAGVGFVIAESVDELIPTLQRIAADEVQPLLTIPAEGSGGYRLGIDHSTHDDLVRKATLALRLLHAGEKANR
jgi:acyl transferase domain-containing protein